MKRYGYRHDVGTPADFNMWEPNTTAERAFNSFGIETLAFGTSSTNYRISGTKTISEQHGSQLIATIDASNVNGLNDDVLKSMHFYFHPLLN